MTTLLQDDEWSKWSDRKIAEKCGVSNKFVGDVRSELSVNGTQMEDRKVERNGTIYTQNTANTGKRETQTLVVDTETGEEIQC